MSTSVAQKSVIVTGAANGVGLSIARRFVKAGALVMMADMDEAKLKKEAEAMAEQKSEVRCYSGDLREKLTIANLLSATIDAYERIDILVNASRQVLTSDPLDAKADAFDDMLHQNVTVPLRLSQAVAKRMIQQKETSESEEPTGAIVNLTSIASERCVPHMLAYSVASAALNQLTRSLAVALAKDGIRVNGVALGGVMSANLRDAMREDDDLLERIEQATPLGRVGEADEAADLAVFLASNAASFVTGQIVAVDGGRSLLDPAGSAAY